ncbi:MAG: CapA family protein [Thermoactinomyces sp.]
MHKMMTLKQKFQRYIKRQQKKAVMHTWFALFTVIALLAILTGLEHTGTTVVKDDPDSRLTLTFVGDMMFGRNIADVIIPKYGSEYLFQYVRPYFRYSDYTTGNFENPIVFQDGYPKAKKFIHLSTRPEVAKTLKKIGFSTVNLANNHMKDFGKQGLLDTLRAFRDVKLDTVGAGSDLKSAAGVEYQTVNGVKIAALGFSDVIPVDFRATHKRSGIAPADPDVWFPAVAKAKKNAQLVIVHMHWGLEYDSRYHPRQKEFGRALIDAGADIVVGHHPHVLEPVEVYKHGVIFYSLGNFIFDQGWSRTRESVLVQYKVLKNGTARLEIHPLLIRQGQPRPLTGAGKVYRREKIYMQITQERIYSNAWNRVWKREENKLVRTVPLPPKLKGGTKS